MDNNRKVNNSKRVGTKKVNKKEKEVSTAFEERKGLEKLVFYVVIVNYGQSENIAKLLKENHSSAQFIKKGEGTATKQVYSILGIEDNRKDVVFSLVGESHVKQIKNELDAYFASSKKNRGIAFTIDVTSIVGVKLYKFFTQTVRG